MRNTSPNTPHRADHRAVPGVVISHRPFLDIPSLAFPADRRSLTVSEVADRFLATKTHVINLIEKGKLVAFDASGRFEYLQVPAVAVDVLAARCNLSREVILEVIATTKAACNTRRASWRIPAKEGFEAFLRENHCQRGL